ncbi:MAG: cytochrome c oxidase subunit II [Bacteroidota bacterium]
MNDFLGLPLDASAHGPEIDAMMGVIHWLMFALFIGWGIFFTYVLIRFRRSRQASADYAGVKSHTSTYLEIGVALIEVVLIIGFAIPLWAKRVNEFPPDSDAVVVRVVAEQFAWNVHYPGPDGLFGPTDISLVSADNPVGLDRSDLDAKDDIVTINQLVLPVGKPVIVRLSSKDVIHSFGVPLLRVKQDVIPGQVIPVWFEPVETTEQIQLKLARQYSLYNSIVNFSTMVVMEEYAGKDSTVIAPKGTVLFPDVVDQLLQAGFTEVLASPETPMEIACAQLCGLGHYRMRASVSIKSMEEYQAWLAEEASYLQP